MMDANIVKILAIDDNQDNLTTLQAVLHDAQPDWLLLTAINGPQGLELARTEDPQVILLDIVMPDMDGFNVCRLLKADESLSGIPVVFLTALRTDRESQIKALEVGGEAFLAKPLNEQELVAQIRAMVKIYAANRLERMNHQELTALVNERTQELERELAERKQAEETAQHAQALSDTVIDSIPGTFYLLDEHGCYVRWNSYQRDTIIGKPDEQIPGMNALVTIHPEDRELIKARIAHVLRDGMEELVEARVLLRGGPAFIWMLLTGRRMMIADRPFLVGTGIDITESKQAEDTIRESEARYKSLFNGISEGFALHEIIVDANGIPCDYRFLDISPSFESQTGLQSADVVGRLQSEVLPNEDPIWVENYGRVALTGEPCQFEHYSSYLNKHPKLPQLIIPTKTVFA